MFRVRIAGTGWSGGPGLTTLYFTSGTYDATSALDVVGAVHSAWNDTFGFVHPISVFHQISGDVDVLDPATGQVTDTVSVTAPGAMQGQSGSAYAPIASAMLVRLSTNLFIAGRRLRGRIFLSPLGINRVQDDGTLTVVGQSYAPGFKTALEAGLESGTAWVVWHRPVGGAGGTAAQITACSASDTLAVLTSRRD